MTLIAAPMAFASAAIGSAGLVPCRPAVGPVIVLCASLFFLGSLLFGARASVRMCPRPASSLARLGPTR